MQWVRDLYEPYLRKLLKKQGVDNPSPAEFDAAFQKLFMRTAATVLVQEPFHDSVRFKGLRRLHADEMGDLIDDPVGYLQRQFGGGKFKINFHEGWNFVATKNFKSQGPPVWRDLPGIDF